MTNLDKLNEAFRQLEAARRNDTGTLKDAQELNRAAFETYISITPLICERIDAMFPPLPTIVPLPPIMSDEALRQMLHEEQPVTTTLPDIKPDKGNLAD